MRRARRRAGAAALALAAALVPAGCERRTPGADTVPASETGSAADLEHSVDRLMATPPVQGATGFGVSVLVAPGAMSDPLSIVPREQGAWINDGGREDGERGGEILAVGGDAAVARIFDSGRERPTAGFGVAPAGFGAFGGQLFTLSQPREGALGPQENHAVLRWPSLSAIRPVSVCSLPTHGAIDQDAPGGGHGLAFGPPAGPFAGRLFVSSMPLGTVYEVSPDGSCRAFLTLSETEWERPLALAFTAAGDRLLVGVLRRETVPAAETAAAPALARRDGRDRPVPAGTGGRGAILQVTADGSVERGAVVEKVEPIWAMAVAPASFGAYGGELFFTGGEPPRDLFGQVGNGKLYRVSRDRGLGVAASGLLRPTGLAFVGDALWVADAKGRRVPGQRIPDGLVIRVVPEGRVDGATAGA